MYNMPKDFMPLTMLTTDVSYTTRGGVSTFLSNMPICVPTTLIPYRGRFNTIPEVFNTIVSKGIKPTMLSYIDITIQGKT